MLVSLWEVASLEAVEFMTEFYGHLKEGKPWSEALKLAHQASQSQIPPTLLLGGLHPPRGGLRQGYCYRLSILYLGAGEGAYATF